MATLSMSAAAAAIGAPCNRRSGLAAAGASRSITSRWRREHRPGRSRRQRRRGEASGRREHQRRPPLRRDQRERHRAQPDGSLPQPAFPARRRPQTSGGAGAVKAAQRRAERGKP